MKEVTVIWFDGYSEVFDKVTEVRFGSDLLYLEFEDDEGSIRNRHIPLRQVIWYSIYKPTREER